jgi:hypothetical protein
MHSHKKLNPVVGFVNGAVQAAKHLRAPIKDYLLAQVGLSAHDIRIFVSAEHVLRASFYQSRHPETFGHDYPWLRILTPQPIQVINASSTSPAILACHLMVDWLDAGKEFSFLVDSPGGSKHGLLWTDDFLIPGLANGKQSHDVPVLAKGRVQTLRYASRHIYNKEIESWAESEGGYSGDEIMAKPPEPLGSRVRTVLSGAVEHARIQFIVVLDNEEVLPFVWNNKGGRFEPGFNSLGISICEP